MAKLDQAGAAANDEARYCVEQMDALAEEIRVGIHAIADNALPAFEASVQRQGERAAGLHLAIARLRQERAKSPVPSPWSTRLEKSAQVLNGLNEQYAALMEHSGHTVCLLQALNGGHAGRQGKTQEFDSCAPWAKTGSWEG